MVQTIGAYVSTFTLSNNTTYYWRVATINGLFGRRDPNERREGDDGKSLKLDRRRWNNRAAQECRA